MEGLALSPWLPFILLSFSEIKNKKKLKGEAAQ
jgi:hypothetical protein